MRSERRSRWCSGRQRRDFSWICEAIWARSNPEGEPRFARNHRATYVNAYARARGIRDWKPLTWAKYVIYRRRNVLQEVNQAVRALQPKENGRRASKRKYIKRPLSHQKIALASGSTLAKMATQQPSRSSRDRILIVLSLCACLLKKRYLSNYILVKVKPHPYTS